MVFGQFLESEDGSRFTWLRGYRDMDARARVNALFYYGPLWRERGGAMNQLMVDSDQVLPLRPLNPGSRVPVMPPADPRADPAAGRGLAVMQIFQVRQDAIESFARDSQSMLATYERAGARQAGMLVTLDAPNNFPQLPALEDGPYLVWLGMVADGASLARDLRPAMDAAMPRWRDDARLVRPPEMVVMEPTARSRMRWRPQ
jgi:hypothetical protein